MMQDYVSKGGSKDQINNNKIYPEETGRPKYRSIILPSSLLISQEKRSINY